MPIFQNYWGTGRQGDHIDLWNGSRLTDRFTWLRIHARIGSFGVHSVTPTSDFEKSAAIWFWEISLKKLLMLIIGATFTLGLGILTISNASTWLASEFVQSDEDMNFLGKIIIFVVYPTLILLGGWLGNLFHRKFLENP